MSENAESDAVTESESAVSTGPKMWIAVLIVVVNLTLIFSFLFLGSTNIENIIGLGLVPLASTFLLVVWWMRSEGVPIRDRRIGLVLFLVIVGGITALHGANGIYLLVVALPILTTLIVLKLLLTFNRPWGMRRRLVVFVMALWTVIFALVRVDAVGGDLIPLMAWRWSPPMAHEFAGAITMASQPPADPITLPAELAPEDWPGFRGSDRDGRATVATFGTDWEANAPKELWRRPVGLGWSSFTVIGDYIFTQEQRGDGEFVICYRADTGDEVWTNYIPARFDDVTGSGPRATPTYADGKLYVQGATGIIQSLDASTGRTIWERNVGDDTGAALPPWGFASSPLLVADKAIVFTGASEGKSVIAYDVTTGEPSWTAGDGSHGYGSGQLAELGGVRQILMISNFGIQSFVPETGEQLWEHEWELPSMARIAQPQVIGDDTIVFGSIRLGVRSIRIAKSGDEWSVTEEWTTKKMRPYFNDIVHHEGYVYGYDGNRLKCLDAATGELQWKGARFGGQVLLLPEMDMLLTITEKGNVVLVNASPEEYTVVAEFEAINGKTWNHPVVAHGRLFVRNAEEAACFELPR